MIVKRQGKHPWRIEEHEEVYDDAGHLVLQGEDVGEGDLDGRFLEGVFASLELLKHHLHIRHHPTRHAYHPDSVIGDFEVSQTQHVALRCDHSQLTRALATPFEKHRVTIPDHLGHAWVGDDDAVTQKVGDSERLGEVGGIGGD